MSEVPLEEPVSFWYIMFLLAFVVATTGAAIGAHDVVYVGAGTMIASCAALVLRAIYESYD